MFRPSNARWLTTTRRRRLWMAVALLLLASPVVGHFSGYTQPDYEYRSTTVEISGDGFEYSDFSFGRDFHGLNGVACTARRALEPVCPVADQFIERNVTAEGWLDSENTKRYLYYDDGLYEWEMSQQRGAETVLRLRPVSPAAVLENVSEPIDEQPPVIRRAVRSGEGRTHHDLGVNGRVVAHDGEYAVVHEYGPRPRGEWSAVLYLAAFVGMLMIGWVWAIYA